MTFSNEPGIYVPGELGLRCEDDIVITADGPAQILSPKLPGVTGETAWLIETQKLSRGASLLWCVEKVIRRIRHAHFKPRGIATIRRGFPALSIDALNGRYRRQHTFPCVAHHLHQQPRYGVSIGRGGIRSRFSRHAAAVRRFP